jgi:hypothetical protein
MLTKNGVVVGPLNVKQSAYMLEKTTVKKTEVKIINEMRRKVRELLNEDNQRD